MRPPFEALRGGLWRWLLLGRVAVVGGEDLVLVTPEVHGERLAVLEGIGAEVAAETHLLGVALLVRDEGRQVGEGARAVPALEVAPLASLTVAQVVAFRWRGVVWTTWRSDVVRNKAQIATQKTDAAGCVGPPQGYGWAQEKRITDRELQDNHLHHGTPNLAVGSKWRHKFLHPVFARRNRLKF